MSYNPEEWSTDTCCNVDESGPHHAKWKKPVTKVYYSVYMNSKPIGTERTSQVVLVEGGVKGERLFFIYLFIFNWKIIALWASLVVQTVKNPPVMWETWVWSLSCEDSAGGGPGNPVQYSCNKTRMSALINSSQHCIGGSRHQARREHKSLPD